MNAQQRAIYLRKKLKETTKLVEGLLSKPTLEVWTMSMSTVFPNVLFVEPEDPKDPVTPVLFVCREHKGLDLLTSEVASFREFGARLLNEGYDRCVARGYGSYLPSCCFKPLFPRDKVADWLS